MGFLSPELNAWIDQLMQNYGLWAVFVLVFLESSGIPLPGETALVTAAIFAGHSNSLAIHEIIAVATAAAVLGDTMGFFIGRTLGLKALQRLAQRFPSMEQRLLVGEYLFLRHGGKIVFWGRFIALLRILAALLAGANKMPWPRFAVMNALGGLFWATGFTVAAYLFGDVIRRMEGPIGIVLLIMAVCGIVAGLFLFRRYEHRIIEHATGEMAKSELWRNRKGFNLLLRRTRRGEAEAAQSSSSS